MEHLLAVSPLVQGRAGGGSRAACDGPV